MTNQLEDDLRVIFAHRAEAVPDAAYDRLRGAGYHPRRRPSRLRVAAGGVGAAAIATTASVVLLTVGPGIQNAFADWTPNPTPAPTGQVASAEATCLQAIVATAASGDSTNANANFDATAADWQPEVEDVRGPFTLVAYQALNGSFTNSASCLSGGSSWSAGPQIMMSDGAGAAISGGPDDGSHAQAQGSSTSSNINPSTGSVGGISTDWNSASNDDVAVGTTGSGVTGVTLTLADGTSVTTTTSNGYFAAWWPGESVVSSAIVYTPQGESTVTFPTS